MAEYLGLKPSWIDSTGVGGGTWEIMAAHAVDAIAAGQADVVVLAYGSTTRADLKKGRRTANLSFGARGPIQYEVPYGHTLIAKYGMATNRHRHDYGTTMEQLAEIAVSHRYNAGFNPDAYYREPITVDDVLVGPDDRRPLHQAAVLHPLRRRLRDRAGRRGPRRRLPHRAGVGARQRPGGVAHDHVASGPTSTPARRRCQARGPSPRPA